MGVTTLFPLLLQSILYARITSTSPTSNQELCFLQSSWKKWDKSRVKRTNNYTLRNFRGQVWSFAGDRGGIEKLLLIHFNPTASTMCTSKTLWTLINQIWKLIQTLISWQREHCEVYRWRWAGAVVASFSVCKILINFRNSAWAP